MIQNLLSSILSPMNFIEMKWRISLRAKWKKYWNNCHANTNKFSRTKSKTKTKRNHQLKTKNIRLLSKLILRPIVSHKQTTKFWTVLMIIVKSISRITEIERNLTGIQVMKVFLINDFFLIWLNFIWQNYTNLFKFKSWFD